MTRDDAVRLFRSLDTHTEDWHDIFYTIEYDPDNDTYGVVEWHEDTIEGGASRAHEFWYYDGASSPWAPPEPPAPRPPNSWDRLYEDVLRQVLVNRGTIRSRIVHADGTSRIVLP